jgi:hypothetical protein
VSIFYKTKEPASVATLDLRPDDGPAEPVAPVMERAKAAIAPFECDIDIEAVNCEVGRLNREVRMMFGIEADAVMAINQKLRDLQRMQLKHRAHQRFADVKHKIDLEVLTWRKPEPLHYGKSVIPQPEVGLFGLTQPWLRLSSTFNGTANWTPKLSPHISKMYGDVASALSELDNSTTHHMSHHISASFSGVVPTETRQKIFAAQTSKAFTDVRILAETSWTLEATPVPFYADPIVVGLVDDEMWVIDIFDPTPLEDYIAREFTT